MHSAFVSHSTSDDRYVAEMNSFLCAAGYDEVFHDVNANRPDEKFWPELEKDDLAAAKAAILSR